jgi:hypothetical protein
LGNNPTVQGIFAMANNALGGVSGLPSLGDINTAVDIINRAFDECKFIYFIPVTKSALIAGSSTSSSDQINIDLSIVPNPFEYQTDIKFSLSQDSKVSVEIYNTIGEKIATLYEGQVVADQVYTFKYTASENTGQQVLLCVIRAPNGQAVKRMVLIR